jgi:Kef-type K+ transport system membrane component KefB
VVGEILAGILLGPSVLGLLWPDGMQKLFPIDSIEILGSISQLGLVFFMFVIGMELDLTSVKSKFQKSLLISHGTIGIAFIASILLALLVLDNQMEISVSPLSFILFLGISFSVTAFPVLARIVFEKGLHQKHAGSVALSCAAIDDLTAWCLLAAAIAYTEAGDFYHTLTILVFVVLFLSIAFLIIQPFFKRFGAIYTTQETLNKTIISIVFLVLLVFSLTSELIGIHALFGAFVAGLIMPPNVKFKQLLTHKVEDISMLVLLPLFFAYTGLRTDFTLLLKSSSLILGFIIIGVATLVKLGFGSFIAFLTGSKWKDALLIGTLLNTRGLMELIVLNIAFEMGVFDQQLFTILVLMALTTTLLTGPLLLIQEKLFAKKIINVNSIDDEKLSILISFAQPKTGKALLSVVASLFKNSNKSTSVVAVHFTPDSDIHRSDIIKYEKESFSEIKKVAEEENFKIKTVYKPTLDVASDVKLLLTENRTDLLFIGGAKSLFSGEYISGKVRSIIQDFQGSFCVLIGNEINSEPNVALVISSLNEISIISILLDNKFKKIDIFIDSSIKSRLHESAYSVVLSTFLLDETGKRILDSDQLEDHSRVENYDILMIDFSNWENKFKKKNISLENFRSILICNIESSCMNKVNQMTEKLLKPRLSQDNEL